MHLVHSLSRKAFTYAYVPDLILDWHIRGTSKTPVCLTFRADLSSSSNMRFTEIIHTLGPAFLVYAISEILKNS